MILIYLPKAFDTLGHIILLDKIKWIDFLTKNKQKVSLLSQTQSFSI